MKSAEMTPLEWATETFGPVARRRSERALRIVEEAIELAQAEGVPGDVLVKLVHRCYSKPAGTTADEFRGLAFTIEAYAELVNVCPVHAAFEEFERLLTIPADHWRKRHQAKVDLGVANSI